MTPQINRVVQFCGEPPNHESVSDNEYLKIHEIGIILDNPRFRQLIHFPILPILKSCKS